jgi:protein-S-isoprenylcysteine O-methyltransferase Ste14
MNENSYAKTLVFLQFLMIGLMLFFSKGVLGTLLALSIFSFFLLFGLVAINYNKLGNFNIQPKLKEGSKLITTGIYAYVRHPMYTSVMGMMLGVLISTPSLIEYFLFFLLFIVLLLKAKKEESLWLKHDEAYKIYKDKSKLFIPFIL